MALPLVDKARIREKVATATVVDGRPITAPTSTEWFKARLFPASGSENADGTGGRRKVVRRPQLMVGLKFVNGEMLPGWDGKGWKEPPLEADQKVEVHSRELGKAVWQIDGEPEPLRKRRRVIGWLANLKRTSEPLREDVF